MSALPHGCAPVAAPRIHVESDVGVLRRVLVHRPGSELARVTDASAEALLFDGRVSMRRAQAEHDGLVAALRAAGADVTQAESALGAVLGSADVRTGIVGRLCAPHAAARRWLAELSAPRLARAVIGGLTAEEVPVGGLSPARRVHPAAGQWLVRPLPNLMFTRDLFSIIGAGAVRGVMQCAARRPETVLTEAMLTHHAELAPLVSWSSGDLHVEGGDILAFGEGVVIVGVGERTSPAAAHALARRLLDGRGAREVIGARIPGGGPFHLDLAVTMVDRDTLLVDPGVVDAMSTVRWRRDATPVAGTGLIAALRAALRGRALRIVAAAPGDHGRRWDRGTNVVAVRPGTVIAYADNDLTNRRLERAGIEVWPISGRALGAGRGGPRCLTAPLARMPLEAP
jgi:arginine deiminase